MFKTLTNLFAKDELVKVKTVKRIESVMMKFEILNAIIGRKKNLHVSYNLNTQ